MDFFDDSFGAAILDRGISHGAGEAANGQTELHDDPALFSAPINLLEGLDIAHWPPPFQGERGACNAFAVTAMEEIHFARITPPITKLSAEFLYAKMRTQPREIGATRLSDRVTARMEETGGTFLHQAIAAINDNGIPRDELAPYELGLEPAAYQETFDPPVAEDARARYPAPIAFAHNVATSDAPNDQREWVNALTETISSTIARQLRGGCPVAASFAIREDAEYVWLGELAQTTGEVRYPAPDLIRGRANVAGHAVCILGFRPDGDAGTGGWFIFRNSLGVDEFGAEPAISPRTAHLPGPGYGMISTADVDRYCWEYLSRKLSDSEAAVA